MMRNCKDQRLMVPVSHQGGTALVSAENVGLQVKSWRSELVTQSIIVLDSKRPGIPQRKSNHLGPCLGL